MMIMTVKDKDIDNKNDNNIDNSNSNHNEITFATEKKIFKE